MSSISSLSQPIPGEDGGITFEECIPSGEDMEEDVMKGLDSEMMRHQLWEAVDSLEEGQNHHKGDEAGREPAGRVQNHSKE